MKLCVCGYRENKSEQELDLGLRNSLMPHWDQSEVKSQGRKKKLCMKFSAFHPQHSG